MSKMYDRRREWATAGVSNRFPLARPGNLYAFMSILGLRGGKELPGRKKNNRTILF